jgi:transcriptional regulator GlxA family with amidase domain
MSDASFTDRAVALERVTLYMQAHFAEPISLATLAALCGLSVFRFATVFRRHYGVPPYRYLCRLRIAHAQHLLRQGAPPAIVAMETGFFDQSHLSKHFKRLCGTTPGRYAAGLDLNHAQA